MRSSEAGVLPKVPPRLRLWAANKLQETYVGVWASLTPSIRFGISPLLDERTPYPTRALMYDDDDFVVVRDLTPTLWIPLRRTHAAV